MKTDYNYTSTSRTRSIYMPLFRNSLPDLFTAFDAPDPSSVSGVRSTSTVAPQALFMLNNPFVIECASAMAKAVLAQTGKTDLERINLVYLALLGRAAKASEIALITQHVLRASATTTDATVLQARWAHVIQALFASPAFRLID
jgi:hypothetical protein